MTYTWFSCPDCGTPTGEGVVSDIQGDKKCRSVEGVPDEYLFEIMTCRCGRAFMWDETVKTTVRE